MSNLKSSNDKPLENSTEEFDSDKQNNDKTNNNNRVRSSTKRPRAPIACFRCHHKKVRCDGARPNCTRCLSTGVLCAYPSSRRSRTTQPTNVDPFIDNLSHLEARIRQIESDLASQRTMVHSILSSPGDNMNIDNETITSTANELNSKMLKTEMEVQDSRSILAQLRLRGEQRILRGKRAAAAAAAAAAASSKTKSTPKEEKTKQKQQQSNTKFPATNRTKSKTKKSNAVNADNDALGEGQHPSFFYQNMMLDTPFSPPGMDWTLFDQDHHKERTSQSLDHQRNDLIVNSSDPVYDTNYLGAMTNTTNLFFPTGSSSSSGAEMMVKGSQNMTSMVLDASPSTRSSSLTSNLGFPVILQPSNSTNSTASNITTSNTSCSSFNSCDNIFNFSMEGVMLQSNPNETGQDMDMLCNNPSSVWYYT